MVKPGGTEGEAARELTATVTAAGGRAGPLCRYLSSLPERVLLFPLVLVIQLTGSALAGMGFVTTSPPALMVGGTLFWLAWFAGILFLAANGTDRLLKKAVGWLRPTALAIVLLLLLVGIAELVFIHTGGWGSDRSQILDGLHRVFVYNDGIALSHQAAENMLAGKNPYAEGNIVTAMQEFHGDFDKTTPLRRGRFADVFPYPTTAELRAVWADAVKDPAHPPVEIETKVNYPAGSFVFSAPFILFGITDVRIIYLVLALPALAAVTLLMPGKLRLAFLAMLAISLALWNSVASGETGFMAFPFMLLGWALAKRFPWVSALFMGLAVATKQIAWFLLPFYVILMWRTLGLKRAAGLVGIVAGAFLVVNLPFILKDPLLWATSTILPMTEPFFPLGVGVVTVVTSGLVVIKSSFVFTGMEAAVFLAALVWYWRNCRRYPHTGPILAMLPLFFAWRSLWSYFFYVDIIALAGILIDEYRGFGAGRKEPVAGTVTAR